MLARARAELGRDAESNWSLSQRRAELVFLVPFAGILLVATRVDLALFDFVLGEDGVVEWVQFAVYAAVVPVALAVALRLRGRDQPLAVGAYLLLALAALFVAGEEVSWGQRVLELETPEELEELNRQGELGIHNLSGVELLLAAAYGIAGLYGSVVAWVLRLRGGDREKLNLYVPPLFLTSFFFLVFAHRLLRLTIPGLSDVTVFVKLGEWPELCFGVALLTFAALNFRRLALPAGRLRET